MSDERWIERDEDAPPPLGEEGADGVEVPFEQLSAAAQRGVLMEFVTREGTEYGESEVPLDTKLDQVRRQIERGEVVLRFDPRSGTVDLIAVRALGRRPARP